MSDKYAAMTAHADRYPMQLMCAALAVSASGYYASVRSPDRPGGGDGTATPRRARHVCPLSTAVRCPTARA